MGKRHEGRDLAGIAADEVPTCEDVAEGATEEELYRTWAVRPDEEPDEEGHVWAHPWALVGGQPENPGVVGHGVGLVITSICLRCGTVRTINTAATDPETGRRIMRVTYHRGLFAEEVAEAATRYRVGR